MSETLCTVREAAAQLGVHVKTVLRFIREGRLPAHRMGKSYRLRQSDVATFAGLPATGTAAAAGSAGEKASITAIVDIPGVATPLAQRWMTMITAALKGRPVGSARLDAQVIHDPVNAQLKVVVVGEPGDAITLLGLVRTCLEQLRA